MEMGHEDAKDLEPDSAYGIYGWGITDMHEAERLSLSICQTLHPVRLVNMVETTERIVYRVLLFVTIEKDLQTKIG